MSLLGDTWDDPRTMGLLAAAQAMMQQRGVGGLLSGATVYGGALAQAKDKERAIAQEKLKQELLRAQIEETRAQGLQRTAQMEAEKEKRGLLGPLMERLNSGGAPSQYGVGGGGIQLGGVREQMTPRPGGIAGLSLDDVAQLELLTGRNVLDHWKTSRTGQEMKPGTWYLKPDGTREYTPNPEKGIGADASGGLRMLPNATNVLGALAGATKEAEAQAANRNTLFTALNAKGEQEPVGTVADVQAWLRQKGPLAFGGQPQPAAQPPARFDPMAMAQAEAVSSGQPVDFNLGGRRGSISPNGEQGPSPIRTGLGPADTWVADPQRGVMRNGLGQTKPITKPDGTVAGSDEQAASNLRDNKWLTASAQARELLAKGPTASGIGTAYDKFSSVFGSEPKGAKEADALRAIGGWLTSNVPRFEGPQGVKDVELYQQMAAAVGDSTLPVSRRLAALDTVDRLIKGTATLNPASVPKPPADSAVKVRRFNLQTGKFED